MTELATGGLAHTAGRRENTVIVRTYGLLMLL